MIDALFPGDPLLCCGLSNSKFATRRREEWRGQLAQQFIVPNPMLNVRGLTQAGRISEHTKNATAARIYLIVEFDREELDLDAQAALHAHLAGSFPLILVVFCGCASLHAWFFTYEAPLPRVREFMRKAITLGADPVTWTRSQFSRMPDGTRDDGSRQTIFYFNPSAIVLP